jgi:hypothetical protein
MRMQLWQGSFFLLASYTFGVGYGVAAFVALWVVQVAIECAD